jgi:hypothetical protein
LGASGSPHGTLLNFAGFVPSSILLLISIAASHRVLPKTGINRLGLALFALFAVLMAIAAYFTCDFECRPDNPTFAHIVHINTALPAYLSAILGLGVIGYNADAWAAEPSIKRFGLGLMLAQFALLFNLNPDIAYVGALQRLLESSLYLWWIYLTIRMRPYGPDGSAAN